MPAEEKSHAQRSAARGRVTDTHGPYNVGEFRVLRVGGTVALHFGTPAGRFVFHLGERSFSLHARSACDDQGNALRTVQEIDAERIRIEEERTPVGEERLAAKPSAELGYRVEIETTPRDARRRLSFETQALYLAAYVELRNTPNATWRQIANKHQLPEASWSTWCHTHKERCDEEVRQSRAPVLKPGGKIL